MLPTIKPTCFTAIQSPISLDSKCEDNPFVFNEKSKQELLQNNIESLQKFSQSSSVNSLVIDLTLERRKAKFVSKISEILANLKQVDIHKLKELQVVYKFVMQSCEDYIQHKDAQIKLDICVSLLKGFCNNDEELCRQIMGLVLPSVKPMTFWRKNKKLIRRGILFFLSRAARVN